MPMNSRNKVASKIHHQLYPKGPLEAISSDEQRARKGYLFLPKVESPNFQI
jgi:hypothetical protein